MRITCYEAWRAGIDLISVHYNFIIAFVLQLLHIGLDLMFYLEGELRSRVEACLRDAREKLMESVKLRALEDKWKPVNFVNENGVARLIDDMRDLGISLIDAWIYGN